MGTQKNNLKETFLLSTKNACLKWCVDMVIFFHRVVEREDENRNTNLNVNGDHRRIIVSIVTYYLLFI